MFAPKTLYRNDQTETLADFRQYVDCYPEAVYLEPEALARCLGRSVVDVEAARKWLVEDGLEVRA